MRSLPTESVEDFSSALFPDYLVSPHSLESVGRLQMANDFHHVPVLADEILECFAGLRAGVLIDATLGGAGHAQLLLSAHEQLSILGIDRDPSSRRAAQEVLILFGDRVRVVAGTFGDIEAIARANADFLDGAPVGVFLDLGVSSPQLDDAVRGFSFRADAPLDMRMDPTSGETAGEVLGRLSVKDLTSLLQRHGESRFAGAIARTIKDAAPETTSALVAAVEKSVPMAARRRGHVATRVFQALRVEVNDEENQLQEALTDALELLAPGGVIAVISYHSGEDRLTKSVLHQAATGGCQCPVALGCVCGAVGTIKVHKASAIMATPSEIARNPRARSARLRYATKLEL